MLAETRQSIFSEIVDFIVSQPSLEEIAGYRVSPVLDERVHHLLEKQREEGLIPEEREELERFLAVSQLMMMAKAKARLHQMSKQK